MEIKKIMLGYPNLKWTKWISRTVWDTHPYNIGILASTIKEDYNVIIIDANHEDLSEEQFSKIIEKEKPDIIGISVLSNEYGKAGDIMAEIAKKSYPEIKIVLGGVHATTSKPEDLMKNPFIDYIVIGEGEYVFKQLCNYLNGKGNFPDKGIAYRKEGKIICNGRVDFIQDLDKLPYPAYDKFDFMSYATRAQREDVGMPREFPYARMMTSRGCPYNCCFCEVGNVVGKKPRLRSVEHVLGEIDFLIKNYGIKSIIFDDDNLLMNIERAKDLFKKMIERKYNLKWNSPAMTVFRLNDEILKLMKESGCQFLNIAIESGVDRVLKEIIHKPLDLDMAREMIKKIKYYKIDLGANFIIGFPGETWEEIRQTLKFAEEIDIDYVRIFIATPCQNTELYRTARDKNYLREGFHFNQHLWTDGWIDTPEFRHQDLKILRAYEWDRINFSNHKKIKKIAQMMDISEERLNEIRKETLKRANP